MIPNSINALDSSAQEMQTKVHNIMLQDKTEPEMNSSSCELSYAVAHTLYQACLIPCIALPHSLEYSNATVPHSSANTDCSSTLKQETQSAIMLIAEPPTLCTWSTLVPLQSPSLVSLFPWMIFYIKDGFDAFDRKIILWVHWYNNHTLPGCYLQDILTTRFPSGESTSKNAPQPPEGIPPNWVLLANNAINIMTQAYFELHNMSPWDSSGLHLLHENGC